MTQHWSRLFVHFAWATKGRAPWIEPAWEGYLHSVIAAQCASLKCAALEVGGTDDHVHVLVRMHVTANVAALARAMKSQSTNSVVETIAGMESFGWQGGYGAVTVGRAHVRRVAEYVRKQRERHRSGRLTSALEITEHQPIDDGFDDD